MNGPEQYFPNRFTVMSIESEAGYLPTSVQDGNEYHPPNLPDVLARTMQQSSTVVVEYFPQDIAENIGRVPVVGHIAKWYVKNHMTVYNTIASIAAETGKRVVTADIATQLGYMTFEPPGPWNSAPFRPEMPEDEHSNLIANHARRVFTARAIGQLLKPGLGANIRGNNSVLYVAAPAHARSVLKRVRREVTPETERIFERYKDKFGRLDTSIRAYDFIDGEWVRTQKIEIV